MGGTYEYRDLSKLNRWVFDVVLTRHVVPPNDVAVKIARSAKIMYVGTLSVESRYVL